MLNRFFKSYNSCELGSILVMLLSTSSLCNAEEYATIFNQSEPQYKTIYIESNVEKNPLDKIKSPDEVKTNDVTIVTQPKNADNTSIPIPDSMKSSEKSTAISTPTINNVPTDNTSIPIPSSMKSNEKSTAISTPTINNITTDNTPIPIPGSMNSNEKSTAISTPTINNITTDNTPIPIPGSMKSSEKSTAISTPTINNITTDNTSIPIPDSIKSNEKSTAISTPTINNVPTDNTPIPIPGSMKSSEKSTAISTPTINNITTDNTSIPIPGSMNSNEKSTAISTLPINNVPTDNTSIPIPGSMKSSEKSTSNKIQSDLKVKNIENNKVIEKVAKKPSTEPLQKEEEIIIEEVILDNEMHTRPIYDHKNIVLPPAISKKEYSEDNRHLPKVFYQSEYTELLFEAVKNNDIQGIKSLLHKGANINAQEMSNGYTLPMQAIKYNRIKALRSLILNGANLQKKNLQGQTALHVATIAGNAQAIEVLMSAGVDATIRDNKGNRASDYMKSNMKQTATLMVENYQDKSKALIDFVGLGAYDAVQLALNLGAKINTRDDINNDGDTPLIIAIKCQDIKMISLLLNRGASLNTTNKRGQTPLKVAGNIKNREIINILQTVKINREIEAMMTKNPRL